ncbi:MAG: serine hydrolase [archaeon]
MTNNKIRRDVLKLLGLGGVGLSLDLLIPRIARAQDGQFDVSYLWTPNKEDAEEYMFQVGRCLGSNVRRDLRLVRGNSGNLGIIYDRNGDRDSTISVSARHSDLLTSCDLDEASFVEDTGYEELYHISFGVGPNLSVQKENFRTIARVLGEGIAKDLVIAETASGNYALIYERYGDRDSGLESASRLSKLLRNSSLEASIIRAGNNNVIFNDQGLLNEKDEEDRARNPVVPPAPKSDSNQKPKPSPTNPPKSTTPSTGNAELEAIVDAYVKGRKNDGYISGSCTTAWSVYDFSTGEKLVSINEDVPMQCASMMKPFVALAFFHQVDHAGYTYGPKSQEHMYKSLVNSNNDSTTWLMNQIGSPAKIQKILQDNYGDIFQQTSIVETIPSNGQTYRNMASAHDYSRFLYQLYYNKLPHSSEIRRLMALGGKRIITRAPAIPKDQGIVCYNKTGTTGLVIGDMGIIVPKDENGVKRPYIMVGIVQRGSKSGSFSTWNANAGNTVGGVSSKVYRHMDAKYDLRG